MHICGLFAVGAKCNWCENGNNIFPRPGIEPGPLVSKSYTLPRRYKSRCIPIFPVMATSELRARFSASKII